MKIKGEGEMAESAEKAKSILELRGIYKDFDGLEVLFDIHLGIQAGERHAGQCHQSQFHRPM